MQQHGMVWCHLIWYKPHTFIIGGKYLCTFGNLFVKTAGKLCSNMGWFAVTWPDMNLKQLLLVGNISVHLEMYLLRQLENCAATWDGLLSLDLIWGKYLFTLGNLFVKTPRKLCSNMEWVAVTWSDMNLIHLLLEGDIYLHWKFFC